MEKSEVLKFIEAMNRRPLRNCPVEKTAEAPVETPAPETPLPAAKKSASRKVRLADAIPGEVITAPGGGAAYCITRPLTPEDACHARLNYEFHTAITHWGSTLQKRLFRCCRISNPCPADAIFLDIETTGLEGTPLFLIGVLVWEADHFVIRQYFARDYEEERAVTALFAEALADKRLLITFNGKRFDFPYIQQRAAQWNVPLPPEPAHCDVLLEARRVWRGRAPDCKLQTLEKHICGRLRSGDIPSSRIPAAYDAFVRTGNAAQVARIIEHNQLDLTTLAELLLKLP